MGVFDRMRMHRRLISITLDHLQRKQVQKAWLEGLDDPHTKFAVSNNGWTDNELGVAWLEKMFEPRTKLRQKGEYRLLVLDGHDSHMSTKAIQFCLDHKIILLCLPPHGTHLLQPLDVGVFGPLAIYYSQGLEEYSQGLSYSVNKADFIRIYEKARKLAFSHKNITHAWAQSGLVPYDPEKVLCKLPPPVQPPIKQRPITPPELTLSSSTSSIPVVVTPSNINDVNSLIAQYTISGNPDVLLKIGKAAKSAFARATLAQSQSDILQIKAKQHAERSKRPKGNYGSGKGRVLGLEELQAREAKEAEKAKEKLEAAQKKAEARLEKQLKTKQAQEQKKQQAQEQKRLAKQQEQLEKDLGLAIIELFSEEEQKDGSNKPKAKPRARRKRTSMTVIPESPEESLMGDYPRQTPLCSSIEPLGSHAQKERQGKFLAINFLAIKFLIFNF